MTTQFSVVSDLFIVTFCIPGNRRESEESRAGSREAGENTPRS